MKLYYAAPTHHLQIVTDKLLIFFLPLNSNSSTTFGYLNFNFYLYNIHPQNIISKS